jgi:hypothetical protein
MVEQHVWEKILRLGQNRRKCWSKHDDTPPMLMASRRPWLHFSQLLLIGFYML